MQNRYAGDVGDFGKFSLISSIFAYPENKIGVIWYQYPNESHNKDGRHIEYLTNPHYKQCNQELVEKLSHVINGERSIAHLEFLNILPTNTVYYSHALDFHLTYKTQKNTHKSARKIARIKWVEKAIESTSSCDVVFLDPDNGLEIKSIPNIYQIKSGKFTYYSEVESLFENKKACIIYHHLNMNNPHESQIKFRSKDLKEKIVKDGTVFALRFRPYSPRAFFICAIASEAEIIRRRIKNYLSSSCSIGWDSYYEL